MKLLDLTLPSPAENLACDEALLDWCEEESGEEILRFWEPREYFVVVGYANKISSEANAAACAENQIPILRRCSGGGTVLQGPGCLNYSLILKISDHEPLQSISSTNRFIMERNRSALEALFTQHGIRNTSLSVAGHTDLALRTPHSALRTPHSALRTPHSALRTPHSALRTPHSALRTPHSALRTPHSALRTPHSALRTPHSALRTPQKFSGNSQRRKKHFLLFHGTFLLHFDISLIETFLPMPSKQPDYRRKRTHSDFLTNLHVPADAVKRALREVWHADEPPKNLPRDRIQLLSRDKYVTKEWNLKF